MCTLRSDVVWIWALVVRLLGVACLQWSSPAPCVESSFNRVQGRHNTAERSHHRLSAGGVRDSCASPWSESHTFTFLSNWILPQSPPEEINRRRVLTPSPLFCFLPRASRFQFCTAVQTAAAPSPALCAQIELSWPCHTLWAVSTHHHESLYHFGNSTSVYRAIALTNSSGIKIWKILLFKFLFSHIFIIWWIYEGYRNGVCYWGLCYAHW